MHESSRFSHVLVSYSNICMCVNKRSSSLFIKLGHKEMSMMIGGAIVDYFGGIVENTSIQDCSLRLEHEECLVLVLQ